MQKNKALHILTPSKPETVQLQQPNQKKYTKNQIKKAGRNLLQNADVDNSMEILSYWRTKHSCSLEKAFELLKEYVAKVSSSNDQSYSPLLAKRLKRTESIVKKLIRYENMQLTGMNDIGGCRAVLSSPKKAYKLSRMLIKDGHFKLRRDYIEEPQESGYRSIHLIGDFKDEDGEFKKVELQIRTKAQHAWATALEIVDLYTKQSIKTRAGDAEWTEFFAVISKLFTVLERNPYLFSSELKSIAREFAKEMIVQKDENLEYALYRTHQLCKRLKIIESFDAYSASISVTSEHIKEMSINGYVLIVIHRVEEKLEVSSSIYRSIDFKEANKRFLVLEKEAIENKSMVVALVSTTSLGGIKEAYPNYFADSKKFIEFLAMLTNVYEMLNPPLSRMVDRIRFSLHKS